MARTKKGLEPEVYLFNEIQIFPDIVNTKKRGSNRVISMPFELRNQEWRKRKVNRGGRPTREEMEKKRAVQRETQRAVKVHVETEVTWNLLRILGIRLGSCPLCRRTL